MRVAPALLILLAACGSPGEPDLTTLPTSPQRPGDAAAGYQYLVYGDYVSSGVPLAAYRATQGTSALDLDRSGDSAGIPYAFNVVSRDGVKLVAPTCLGCHAESLFGTLTLGLGSNTSDFTGSQSITVQLADAYVKQQYGADSPEYAAFVPFKRASLAIADLVVTEVRGVNPADKVFAVLSSHRDPTTLAWLDRPTTQVEAEVVPTDVPPWWNVKKKAALYYNGLGQGDWARLSSASGMLTLDDVAEAEAIDAHFPDVMAWIETLAAPAYPFAVDQALAAKGRAVFEDTCTRCHGTYGEQASYPKLLVSLDEVGTDPLLARSYTANPTYTNWYDASWYATGEHAAHLTPQPGYVAPPLDGVWASAPYFHNASVPTIAAVLDSRRRPAFWKRGFTNGTSEYDQAAVGWLFQTLATKLDGETYDTSKPGYGSGGHTFGDELSDDERVAVLEYLKTL